MKRILSIILTVCMVVSTAAVCTVFSGAALDPASYPNVKIFAGLTQDQVAAGQGYAGSRTSATVVTAKSTHYDITTSSASAADEYVYVKLPALQPGSTYTYMAYKYKLTSGAKTCNEWLYVDGTFADGTSMGAGATNSGWRRNPHNTSSGTAGTGKWTTVIIALPDGFSQNAGAGTFDMTATVDSIRFGTPTTNASTLSIAWTGLFKSEADITAFDTAFNAQYTLEDDATTSTKTEVFPATQNIANASLTDGTNTYTVPHKITFDDSDYVAYVGKNASGDDSPLRRTWTSRQVNDSAKFVTDSDGNTYFAVASFYTSYSDFRFANGNGFLYSADVRYTDDVTNFRGFIVNFGNERTAENKGNVFYENNKINADGAYSYTGYSGCGIYLTKTNAVRLFVYTVDANGKLGVIDTDIAITTATSSWTSLKIYDDGSSTISFYIGTEYIGKIVYSNAGLLPLEVTDYNERYYRTAVIYGKDGTKLAETTNAVISYTKAFAMGTRATSMNVDNLEIAAYKAPAENVSVSLGSVSGEIGSTVTVPVTLNSPSVKIAGVHTIVNYDATKLSFDGYEWGTAFATPTGSYALLDLGASETTSGVIDVFMMNVGSNGFENAAATGVLLNLKFTVLTAATVGDEVALTFSSPTTADDITGYDANYAPIDFAPVYTAGKVTVEAAAAPTTPTEITLTSDATISIDSTKTYIVMPSSAKVTSYANFKKMFNDVDYLVFKNASGTEITSGRYIGTGFTVSLVVNGETLQTLTVYMVGDVDSDGKVSMTDSTQLSAYISSSTTLTGALKLAANADGDSRGRITKADCVAVKNFVRSGKFN